jgi:glycosyltransferase involved in cell wall biosynthesis
MSEHTPAISVITATYNRSNVLRHAIESLRRNTFQDWEQIVVGDACTDDTAEVVASFNDPRIRYVNLAKNCGEQSGPNNAGFALSRGRLIAYLNHDDLWLPDHLSSLTKHMDETKADLVFALGIAIIRDGFNQLFGESPDGSYAPHLFYPASSWLARRELIAHFPWRSHRALYNAPSQDVLYRAWRAGKRLMACPQISVIAIQSGNRLGSYANREYEEHAVHARRMQEEPDYLARELLSVARGEMRKQGDLRLWPAARTFLRNVIYRSSMALHIPPNAVAAFARYKRRGSVIPYLRKVRGLPPLPQ